MLALDIANHIIAIASLYSILVEYVKQSRRHKTKSMWEFNIWLLGYHELQWMRYTQNYYNTWSNLEDSCQKKACLKSSCISRIMFCFDIVNHIITIASLYSALMDYLKEFRRHFTKSLKELDIRNGCLIFSITDAVFLMLTTWNDHKVYSLTCTRMNPLSTDPSQLISRRYVS